jgi:hypothetical protein
LSLGNNFLLGRDREEFSPPELVARHVELVLRLLSSRLRRADIYPHIELG